MSEPAQTSTAPRADILEQALEAYGRLWRKNLAMANDIWKDLIGKDATFSNWTIGYSKLMHAWTESARELLGLVGGRLQGAAPECPVLSFVLDAQTEASKEQTIVLPPGVDPSRIVSTPLAPLDGARPLPQHAQVTATPDAQRRCVDLTIAGLGSDPKQGNYFAVVYEQLSRTASPPRRSFALVIVSFLAS